MLRSHDEQPVRVSGSTSMDDGSPASAITGQALVVRGPLRGSNRAQNLAPQATGCYILPTEYSTSSEQPVVRIYHRIWFGISWLFTQKARSRHVDNAQFAWCNRASMTCRGQIDARHVCNVQ